MRSNYKTICTLLAILAFLLGMQAPSSSASPGQSSGTNSKVELNSATERELESLPGVGGATAKKIISGRPYSSVNELSKAGVSAAVIKKIAPLVIVGGAASAPVNTPSKSATSAKQNASSAPGAKVDLNSASATELKELPGVGDATAKKIISARPYSSVNDLSKAGVSAATIGKITPLVTTGNASAIGSSSPPTPASSNSPNSSAAAPEAPPALPPAAAAKSSPPAQGSPGNGMVWVNTDSGVYHKEGTRYYGTTKNGKYMSESDAVRAGYRAAKKE